MIARRWLLPGVVLSLILPGCVVEQRDFEALREQVRLQQRQINEYKARQEEQGLRIDTLNNGFKILGDKAEENARRIDGLSESGAAPAPLVAPQAALPDAPASEEPLTTPPVELPAVASPAPAPLEEPVLLTNQSKTGILEPPPGGEIITAGPKAEKLYAGALALYSGRDYQQATLKFEEFVNKYPEHKLAGNAQYWIGECYYSQRRFAEAADEFAKVETDFPTSLKVPAALFKIGLSFAELKKMPEARAALERIIERHGQTEEAAKAREKLERWRQP